MFKPFDISKTGLTEKVIEEIKGVLQRFPEIEKAVIYGSRAKRNFRTGSDIDLCLIGKNLSSSAIPSLDRQLDELMLPYTFDLSVYDEIDSPNFKDHIDRVGMVFYERVS